MTKLLISIPMLLTTILSKVKKSQNSKTIPNILVGNIVQVKTLIKEGNKERLQQYEGTVIAKKGKDIITVRRSFQGIGIEYTFSLYAPQIVEVNIKRQSKVRRGKLFYLRNRIGKRAELKNKITSVIV